MNVFFSDEQDESADGGDLRHLAEVVLQQESFPASTEVAVMLVDSTQMTSYNERFMGRRGPTDVLAFPLEELVPGVAPSVMSDEPPIALGDVLLCPSEIAGRAVAEGVEYQNLLHLLLVHGMLHLLGYGHEDDAASHRMAHREDELLSAAGKVVP